MILIDFIKNNENWREILSGSPYNITIKEKNGYALFKYNQLESDMSNPLVQTCRGIIVDLEDTHSYPKYSFDKEFFTVESPALYYFLGLLASDGNVSKDHNTVSISQSHDRGKRLLEYIKKLLKTNYPLGYTESVDSYKLSITNHALKLKLDKWNISSAKTKYFKLNANYNPEYIKYFIQGYIEGDGCITISRNKQGYRYLHCSFFGTQDLISQLCSFIPIKSNKRQIKGFMEARWYGEKAEQVCKWIYEDPVFPEGKYSVYNNFSSHRKKDKYDKIRQEIQNIIDKDKIETVPELLKTYKKVSFQTIYVWKKEGRIKFYEGS